VSQNFGRNWNKILGIFVKGILFYRWGVWYTSSGVLGVKRTGTYLNPYAG
jgi:hypothetical protein